MMRVPWYLRRGYALTPAERARRALADTARGAAWLLPRRVLYWAVIRAALIADPDGPETLQAPVGSLLDALGISES